MDNILRIGLLVERSRAFGRALCEGVVTYAQNRPWEIRYLEPDDLRARHRADFDGYIARVTTDAIARALAATGKPVVDVFYNLPDYGFAIVKEKHEAIGRLAAEHFIDRRFKHFAYCPYGAGKTSVYCRTAFAQRLRREGFSCDVFASASEIAYPTDDREIIGNRIARPKDAPALGRWLAKLPKPVAIFCPDDLRAWQVLEACITQSLSIPSDVAVLGLDNDILICGGTRPMLSSIDPNTREIGRVAAETLEGMMEKAKGGSREAEQMNISKSTVQPRTSNLQPHKPLVRQVEPTGVIARASTEIYPLDPPWLSDVLVFISREARHGISARDVFAKFNRSHTAISRAFARELGTTVQKEIARARLETACGLLRTTALELAEIARLSGFASLTYFMHAFTAAFRTPPGEWRATHG